MREQRGRKFFEPPLWIAVHWKNVDKSGLYFKNTILTFCEEMKKTRKSHILSAWKGFPEKEKMRKA